MKTFFRELVLIIGLVSGIVFGTQAQRVPGAVKYQAVLRDVNGKTLANKENVNLRISLRLDDPTAGQIAYSEEHMGLATNAYGVINLEIGRGTVTSGKDLHEVPWAQHDIYVQIEIETDGTGYTHMGNAELLTVPYAFYAENASGDRLYENLDDNVLPKYNAANKTLVNSGVSQKGRELEVDASSITFINKADGNMNGYKFPMTVGRRGQVLGFTDNVGTLGWTDVQGGSGPVNLNLQGDGQLVYWNDDKGELDTVTALRYDYKGTRNLDLNTDITGLNNVLVSDKLGDGQIWVGDGFSNRLAPVSLSGAVRMDKTGKTTLNLDGHVVMDADKTRLNLAMKGGIKLISGRNGAIDTLAVDTDGLGGGGGESLWELNDRGTKIYPKDFRNRYVGIGVDNPISLLHVQDGDVRFAQAPSVQFFGEEIPVDGESDNDQTPYFYWNGYKSSLFVGSVSRKNLSTHLYNQGEHSIAMGFESLAIPDYTFALGQEASVTTGATDAFAIGNYSKAQGVSSVALGNGAEAVGNKSIALGNLAVASGANSVVLGASQNASSDAVVVGYNNGNVDPIQNAVVVGSGNDINDKTGSIVLGKGNNIENGNAFVIGNNISDIPSNSLIVGKKGSGFSGAIVVGSITNDGSLSGVVSVGRNNYIGDDATQNGYTNMLGSNLTKNTNVQNLTMIGSGFTDQDGDKVGMTYPPLFLYGRNTVFFGIDNQGDAFFGGDVYSSGVPLSSDERLKTDIQPMLWTPNFLDSITPVSYIFKSDKQKRTRFGFIAQDVRRVFPELVRGDENKGMLSLDYVGLVPVLWQINQNLSHQVNDLEKRLEEQSRKQAELEGELQAIKEKLGM